MRLVLAALTLSLSLAASSAPALAQFDTGGMAKRLRSGMTVGEVVLALGYRPTEATPDLACRRDTGEPIACRVWVYATDLQVLHIYFRYSEAQRQWLVYSWRL